MRTRTRKDCRICRKEYFAKGLCKDHYFSDPTHKLRFKALQLKYHYGISTEDYNAVLIAQNYKCAICGIKQGEQARSLSVDHNHKTNKIRGLLCGKCNRGIGYLNEDIDCLKKAIRYLNKKI